MDARTKSTSVFRFGKLQAIAAATLLTLLTLSPARAGLEAQLPADTLVYAHWAGRSLTFDGSQFGQLIQQDSMFDLMKIGIRQICVSSGQAGPGQADDIIKLLDIAWQRPITLGLAGLNKEDGLSRGQLFIELGKDRAEFEKTLDSILAGFGQKQPPATAMGKGSYRIAAQTAGRVAYGFVGEAFFATLGPDEAKTKLQAQAILTGKNPPGLDKNKKFTTCLRKKPLHGPNVQLAFYVDVAAIFTQAEALLPAPAPATQPASAPANPLRKITTALGVDKLSAIAGTLRIVNKGMLSKVRLFTPGPHRGILLPLAGEPLDARDIAAIPADADFALAWNIAPGEMLDEIIKIATAISPPAGGMIDKTLAMASGPVGVSLRKDVINALGDTWLLSSAESQGGLLTGTVLSVELKDPKTFSQTLAKIETNLAKLLAGPGPASQPGQATKPAKPAKPSRASRPKPAVSFEKTVIDDIEIRYLRIPHSAGLAFLPAWAVHKNRLYVAAWPQVIGSTLTNKTPSLRKTPAFKKIRARVARKASMLTYVNVPQLARRIYPLEPIFRTVLANMLAKKLDMPASVKLSPATIQKTLELLRPSIDAISHDAKGITLEGFGSGPSLTAALPAAAVGVSALIPALNNARHQAKKAVSAANLNSIGKGCMIYAATNDDRLPTNLSQLVDEGFISTRSLVSPVSGKRPPGVDKKSKKLIGPVDYILINYAPKTLDSIASPAQAILAYERPGNYQNKGTWVAFVDGHVEWVPMTQFNKLLTATGQAGGKEVGK